jgi:hypothetical protein
MQCIPMREAGETAHVPPPPPPPPPSFLLRFSFIHTISAQTLIFESVPRHALLPTRAPRPMRPRPILTSPPQATAPATPACPPVPPPCNSNTCHRRPTCCFSVPFIGLRRFQPHSFDRKQTSLTLPVF